MEVVFNANGNSKQIQAIEAWMNPEVTDIVYGGSKGSGKSFLGCNMIFGDAFIYPETYYFICRKSLNDLRKYTMPSIYEVLSGWGLKEKIDYTFNGQDNFYELRNKSRVYLIDLAYSPQDPEYTRFGSRQCTRLWVEEAAENDFAAVQNISACVGRWNNKKYGLVGKTLQTCNPHKGYLYRNYYKPNKDGTLDTWKRFIQALPADNKMLADGYLEHLHRTFTYNQKQRLLFGNWDYDDDPSVMCDWEAISDAFTNEIKPNSGAKMLAADLAMKGRDRFIVGMGEGDKDGMVITLVVDKPKANGKIIETDLREQMQRHSVGHSKTIVDSDGMGAYLESYLEGIHEFHGGGRAINDEFYKIKDECGYKLAEMINKRLLRIICTPEQRGRIEQQLSALKADDIDADTRKKKIVTKDVMKEQIGHSPDDMDMLLMMCWFLCEEFSEGYVGR